MAVTDIYHIGGNLKPSRKSIAFIDSDHDDYIQVNAAAVALVTSNDTTSSFTAWINIANTVGNFTIIGAGDDNVVEFLELNIEAGLLTLRITDATVVQVVTQADGNNLEAHRWYHVGVVQPADGTGPRLYINGIRIAATNDTSTDVDSWWAELDGIDTMRIGAANKAGNATVTNDFRGGISDVKIWQKIMSDQEMIDDAEGKSNTTSLHNHWDWNDDFVDAGTGADNGTSVGDVILINVYSEFTSRLRHLTGSPVVADTLVIWGDSSAAHAVVIQAA